MNKVVVFVVGLVVGGTLTGLVVKMMWDEDQRFLSQANREINAQYFAAWSKSGDLERRLETISGNSYNRQAIVSCMFMSTTRFDAIQSHIFQRPLNSIEDGALAPMMPVVVATQGQSVQRRQLALIEESRKLDNECLDRAKISFPDLPVRTES